MGDHEHGAMLRRTSIAMPQDLRSKPEGGKCNLLKLSGELRNRIYEYALSYDRQLKFEYDATTNTGKWFKRSSSKQGSQDIDKFAAVLSEALLEVNQLRFVNKQLYTETKGLEIWYNDLTFESLEDAGYFFKRCASVHLNHVRTVTYHIGARSPAIREHEVKLQASINKFCKAHPYALVRAILSGYSSNYRVDCQHLAITAIVLGRTQSLLDTLPRVDRKAEIVALAHTYGQELGISPDMFPSNHRFFAEDKPLERSHLETIYDANAGGLGMTDQRDDFAETYLRFSRHGF